MASFKNMLMSSAAVAALAAYPVAAQEADAELTTGDPATVAQEESAQSAPPGAPRPYDEVYGGEYADLGDRNVSELVGLSVMNDAGETIGDVDSFGLAGDKLVAIIGIGGFLGLGEHSVAIPLEQFTFDGQTLVLAGVTREQLEQMPEYDEASTQTFAEDTSLRSEYESGMAGLGTTEEQPPAEGETDVVEITPQDQPAEEAETAEVITEEQPAEEAETAEVITEDQPAEDAETAEVITEDQPAEDQVELTEGATEEQPAEEAQMAEGATEEQPVEEAQMAEGATEEQPAEEAQMAEGVTEEQPADQVELTEGATEEQPAEEAQMAEGMTEEQPDAEAETAEVITEEEPQAEMETAEADANPVEGVESETVEAEVETTDAEPVETAEQGGWTDEMDQIFGSIADQQIADLVGMDVAGSDGEVIGEVENFALMGDEVVAVVGIGGFLGIGQHDVALSLGELTFDGERLVASGYTEEDLRQLPEYDEATATVVPGESTLRGSYDQ